MRGAADSMKVTRARTPGHALKVYADFAGITEEKARRIRDDFFPKPSVSPDAITGLDLIIPDAVALKFISAPLGREQLDELIQIPPRK